MTLKLFVWFGWMRDYTGGIAVVVATTSDEAKKLLFDEYVEQEGYSPQEQGQRPILEDFHNLRDPEVVPIKKGVVLRVDGGG